MLQSDVPTDHIRRHFIPNRSHEVPVTPQFPTPQLLRQFRMPTKHLPRRYTLENLYHDGPSLAAEVVSWRCIHLRNLFVWFGVPVVAGRLAALPAGLHHARWLSGFSLSLAIGVGTGRILTGYVIGFLGLSVGLGCLAALPAAAILLLVFRKGGGYRPHALLRPVRGRNEKPRTLRVLYLSIVLSGIGVIGSQALLFVYMYEVGMTILSMGLVSAVTPVAAALSSSVSHKGVQHIPSTRVIVAGFLLSSIGPLVFLLSGTGLGLAGLVAGHVLIGAAVGPLFVGTATYITDRTNPSDLTHGRLIGFIESARGLGGLIGPPLAGLVVLAAGRQL